MSSKFTTNSETPSRQIAGYRQGQIVLPKTKNIKLPFKSLFWLHSILSFQITLLETFDANVSLNLSLFFGPPNVIWLRENYLADAYAYGAPSCTDTTLSFSYMAFFVPSTLSSRSDFCTLYAGYIKSKFFQKSQKKAKIGQISQNFQKKPNLPKKSQN
jgi:hypothetical protein